MSMTRKRIIFLSKNMSPKRINQNDVIEKFEKDVTTMTCKFHMIFSLLYDQAFKYLLFRV